MRDHIVLLVDASGSMSAATKETQESVSNIIKNLKQTDHFKLVFFDSDEYQEVVNNVGSSKIPPELGYLFKARGCTPITDAAYKAIQDLSKGLSLEQMNEPHRIIIFTDGGENASHYSTAQQLGAAIKHFTENFGWDFKFLGPETDKNSIFNYTQSINIAEKNVTLYADVQSGLKEMESAVTA